MRVRVLFFGQLKDIAGCAEDSAEVAPGATLADVFRYYAARFPRLAALESSTVLARNQRFVSRSTALEEGDEVAFLPPVSGGNGHFFALGRTEIDVQKLKARLLEGSDGAIVAFEGVVRNNTKGRATRFLDYECYEPMALKVMEDLGLALAAEHAIGRIAMVHRLGRMEIGETSVAIVVTAPHRRAAFEAALDGINRLKKLVPIWKKEHFADGEVWVEGEWDESLLR